MKRRNMQQIYKMMKSLFILSLVVVFFSRIEAIETSGYDESAKSLRGKVAVCISGGVRMSNEAKVKNHFSKFTFILQRMSTIQKEAFFKWVEQEDPLVVDSIHEYLYTALQNFDVFMAINPPDHAKGCSGYEPRLRRGTTSSSIESSSTNGTHDIVRSPRMFCDKYDFHSPTQEQLKVDDNVWAYAKNHFQPNRSEYFEKHFLGQMWDYTRCMNMIEKEENKTGVLYDVIVRLRPDTMIFAPFQEISLQTTGTCINDIREFGSGGEDILNIGRRKEMGYFMKRVWDVQNVWKVMDATMRSKLYTAETYAVTWWKMICGNATEASKNSKIINGFRQHTQDWLFHPYHFNEFQREEDVMLNEEEKIKRKKQEAAEGKENKTGEGNDKKVEEADNIKVYKYYDNNRTWKQWRDSFSGGSGFNKYAT